jgi:hypothetical protein
MILILFEEHIELFQIIQFFFVCEKLPHIFDMLYKNFRTQINVICIPRLCMLHNFHIS